MKRSRVSETAFRRFGFRAPHYLNVKVGYRGGERK